MIRTMPEIIKCVTELSLQNNSQELAICSCGKSPETWLRNSWAITGCKVCGKTVKAYKSFNKAHNRWNNLMGNN